MPPEEILKLQNQVSELREIVSDYRQVSAGSYYDNDDDTKNFEKIRNAFRRHEVAQGFRDGQHDGETNTQIRMLQLENEKLWYLVRSLGGDETVGKDGQVMDAPAQLIVASPFGKRL